MKIYDLTLLAKNIRLSIFASILVAPVLAATKSPEPIHNAGVDSSTESISIDRIWAGIPVVISAVAVGSVVYVGYYDADRNMSVARVDTSTGLVRKRALNSIFGGWDAHNYITLFYDQYNLLHVAGNMHTTPLIYARMHEPDELDSLDRVDRMVGKDETNTTYPRFFPFSDGQLGFTYRSGKSGDGVEIVNKFDGNSWLRNSDSPIFAPAPGGTPVNAYHTGYIRGPDGYFHIAWVWRLNSNVESNFNVNYAKSNDLRSWTDSKGRPLSLPMTPANADLVDKIAPGSGLFNNIRLGFNRLNEPVISYVKFDKDGNTQLYHARSKAAGWQVVAVTNWKSRWNFSGGGTRTQDIWFSGVRVKGERVLESVRHFKEGNLQVSYQRDAMNRLGVSDEPAAPNRECQSKPWRQSEVSISSARPGSFEGKIVWRTLPGGNADRPRSCQQLGLPEGCSMTSQLWLLPKKNASPRQALRFACEK